MVVVVLGVVIVVMVMDHSATIRRSFCADEVGGRLRRSLSTLMEPILPQQLLFGVNSCFALI